MGVLQSKQRCLLRDTKTRFGHRVKINTNTVLQHFPLKSSGSKRQTLRSHELIFNLVLEQNVHGDFSQRREDHVKIECPKSGTAASIDSM